MEDDAYTYHYYDRLRDVLRERTGDYSGDARAVHNRLMRGRDTHCQLAYRTRGLLQRGDQCLHVHVWHTHRADILHTQAVMLSPFTGQSGGDNHD